MEEVRAKATQRFHSDDVTVCLQRAMSRIDELELELGRVTLARSVDPQERLAATLQVIAELLERQEKRELADRKELEAELANEP